MGRSFSSIMETETYLQPLFYILSLEEKVDSQSSPFIDYQYSFQKILKHQKPDEITSNHVYSHQTQVLFLEKYNHHHTQPQKT